jgi:2-phospho-L-lactate guanylyltransferase (CobY/MobA/RfbA family)
MRWILFVLGALVVLAAVIAAIGATLPRNHVASRTLRVKRAPDEAWTAITQAMTASDVPTDIVESDPPKRLMSRVKETEKMFGGTWTVTIAPVEGGSALTITEDGWVANPIFRFVSRFVMGHHATMDGMLKTVARSFGEEPVLSGE